MTKTYSENPRTEINIQAHEVAIPEQIKKFFSQFKPQEITELSADAFRLAKMSSIEHVDEQDKADWFKQTSFDLISFCKRWSSLMNKIKKFELP